MRLVGGVGEVLGLEAESAATWEGGTVLAAVAVGPVVGVELHGGLGGVNLHSAAADGLGDAGGKCEFAYFFLVDDVAVVVAGTVANLLVIGVPAFAYFVRSAEVEGSAFYTENLTRGDVGLVGGHIEVSVDFYYLMLDGGGRVGNALQGEEAVVCHVAHGLLVGVALVIYDELILISKGEHDVHLQFAGETFFIIGAGVTHHYALVVNLLGVPYAGVEAGGAAVKVVGTIVDGEVVVLAVELEGTAADAVTITSHERGEEGLGGSDAVGNAVVALNDVGHIALTIGYHNGHDATAIIRDGYLAAICISQEEEVNLFSIYNLLEVSALQAADGGNCLVHKLRNVKP